MKAPLDNYDTGLNFDPRNFVGIQVAKAIHARTGLAPDFCTNMGGRSALGIANDLHQGKYDANHSMHHRTFAANWKK